MNLADKVMEETLEMTCGQNAHLAATVFQLRPRGIRAEVLTGDASDLYWGWDNDIGENILGQLWKEVHSNLVKKLGSPDHPDSIKIRVGFSKEVSEAVGIDYNSNQEFSGTLSRKDILSYIPVLTRANLKLIPYEYVPNEEIPQSVNSEDESIIADLNQLIIWNKNLIYIEPLTDNSITPGLGCITTDGSVAKIEERY